MPQGLPHDDGITGTGTYPGLLMRRTLELWHRRVLVAMVIVVAALALFAPPAFGHAALLTTSPADGVVLDTAPSEVTFQFTEPVALQPDGVRVIDGDGDRFDASTAVAEGTIVTAPLAADLADGTYVVAWRVVSADGHPVRGAFTFSVGQESELRAGLVDEAFASGGDRSYEIAGAVLRMIAYISVLGACGYVVVSALLRRDDEPSPVQRAVVVAAAIGIGSLVLQLVLQAALVAGGGPGSIAESGVLRLVAGDGFGVAVLVAVVALLAMSITVGLPFAGPVRALALGGAVMAPLAFALTGHTRTMSPAVVGYLADAVHLAAGTVWFGGLLALTSAVRRRRNSGDALGSAEAVATFSGLAAVSAGAVIVAGLALSWIEVGGLDALTSTTYGRLLSAKVAAVGLVLVLAAWNRFRLVPAVARDALDHPDTTTTAGWTTLGRVVRAEAVVLIAVLAITGVLANVTPAKAALVGGPVTVSAPLGGGTVDVTVDPARPGRNDVHIYLLDDQGRPDDRFEVPTLRLELPDQSVGPFDVVPVRVGPGHVQLVGADLPLAGRWELEITVKPDRFTEQVATVSFAVK